MGQSTDAYLFFGLASEDESVTPESVAVRLGWTKAEEGYDEEDWAFPEDEDYDYYDDAIKHLEPLGLEMGSHCSHDFPMAFIAAVRLCAWRGNPVAIDGLPKIPGEKVKALTELGEKLGLGKPRWWLASDWG